MITAANAPYSSVPTQSPSPTTGADYQQISGISPESFGSQIGAAQSRLGQEFEQAGGRFAENAIAQQRLINQTAADNSVNWFNDEATKILHGDPNKPGDVGFYGLKGLDAVNARQSTMQKLDALIQSARGQLTNQRQILAFDNESRRQRNFMADRIGSHYDQQLTQTAINSATAGMNLAGQGMAVAAANQDMEAFNHKIEDYMTSAIKHNQAVGGTQEMLDMEFQKIRGAATKQWVEGLVDKNPTKARDFLEANKDALLPNEYHQLHGMVRAGADKAEVNRWVYGAPKGNLAAGGSKPGDPRGMIPVIQSAAAKYGVDPDVALRVARSEGLGAFSGDNNTSFGSFQLHIGGGLGDEFKRDTGLDPSDPKNEIETIDYAMRRVAETGWAPYHGAARVGVGNREGIGTISNQQPAITRVSQTEPPPDVLINNRPLPMREATELPDAEIPGAYLNGRQGPVTLSQKIQELAHDMPNNNEHDSEMFVKAVKGARSLANGLYADHQHALKAYNEQVKAIGEAQKDSYIARIYPRDGSPTQVTETDIANDLKLSPEMKENIINFYRTATKPGPTAAVDSKTTAALFERIHADWGTPDKIVDMRPIDQAKGIDNTISKSSYDWLEKQVKDSRTAEGEALGARKKNLVETYKRAITKSNPMLGATDDEGDVNYGRYQKYVDEQVEKRKAENKNPYDLFTEGGSEYLGRPAVLRMFQKPLQSSIKSITDQLQANPNYVPPGTAIPNVPPTVILPRQPSETPADYLKRIGK